VGHRPPRVAVAEHVAARVDGQLRLEAGAGVAPPVGPEAGGGLGQGPDPQLGEPQPGDATTPPFTGASQPRRRAGGPTGAVPVPAAAVPLPGSCGDSVPPAMATDPWGLDVGYVDGYGNWHATSPDTAAVLRAAMGAEDREEPLEPRPLWVVP